MRRFTPRFWLRVTIVCWVAAIGVALGVALASCGSTSPQIGVGPTSPVKVLCPPGASFMGCASGASPISASALPKGGLSVTAPVPGCKFPDVSSYQGHPNWPAAAPVICAAVAKAGEAGFEDPDFAYNVTSLRALHVPWSAYWFVRGCSEGGAFVSVLDSVRFRGDRDALRPVLDMEVPAAAGCAVPMADAIHAAFGVWPIIYTAPGTWPGGSSGGLQVWEADYGPTLGALPFAATVLAWQRYSPPFAYYAIPGLGYGDVSIDLRGFAKSFAFPAPKPSPFAIFPLRPVELYHQKISERLTVERWYTAKCSNPVRRVVCRTTRTHLTWLAGRLLLLAEAAGTRHAVAQPTRDDWAPNDWGARHYRIERILHSR